MQFELEGRGIVVTASGRVDPAQVRATFDKVWKRPESSLLRYHILHVEEGCVANFGLTDFRDIGLLVPEAMEHSPDVRMALVTNSVVMMGMLRMAAVYSRVWARAPKLELFWTMDEARRWVRLECPDMFDRG